MRCRIRKSPDQSLLISSPRLIADRYVLHRSFESRHPPYALMSLPCQILQRIWRVFTLLNNFAKRNCRNAAFNRVNRSIAICQRKALTDQQLAITNCIFWSCLAIHFVFRAISERKHTFSFYPSIVKVPFSTEISTDNFLIIRWYFSPRELKNRFKGSG